MEQMAVLAIAVLCLKTQFTLCCTSAANHQIGKESLTQEQQRHQLHVSCVYSVRAVNCQLDLIHHSRTPLHISRRPDEQSTAGSPFIYVSLWYGKMN